MKHVKSQMPTIMSYSPTMEVNFGYLRRNAKVFDLVTIETPDK